jgi:hypothetical protein
MAEALHLERPWLSARHHGPCRECHSRTAELFWGDGCSDCMRDDLGLSEAREAARVDAAIDAWKDEAP